MKVSSSFSLPQRDEHSINLEGNPIISLQRIECLLIGGGWHVNSQAVPM